MTRIDHDLWWEVAASCPYATFFHSPLWHRLMSATDQDRRDATVGAVLDNGTRAILPLMEGRGPLKGAFRRRVSTFAGCYGGVVADGPLQRDDVEALYGAASAGRVGVLRVVENPLRNDHVAPRLRSFETTVSHDFTHMLRLNRTLDEVVSGFSRGAKSSLRQGRRKGVTVRQAATLGDYRSYFDVYRDTLRRWGDRATSVYPWRLFEVGHELARAHPGHLRLWLTEVGERVIGGAWVFYWNRHVDYWHGASYEDYFDRRPNNVLHVEILRHAIEHGYGYYDLNPSGGHEGVARFKDGFGATRSPIRRWAFTSKALSLRSRMRPA
jgi:hypothetical protein